MPTDYIAIFITAPSKREAKAIILHLIKKRLIACGNIIGHIDSIFIWKGKVDRAKENLVILKTRSGLFKAICAEVEKVHSYEVPEIIAVPIEAGSAKYLEWIKSVCK